MVATKLGAGLAEYQSVTKCPSMMDLTLREVAFRMAFVSLTLTLTAVNLW